jgi:hypothetical protein
MFNKLDLIKSQCKKNQNIGLDSILHGRTLLVYKYMLKKAKPVGPRELQRYPDLSSPGLALFHLHKLETAGLVTKNENDGSFIIDSVYLKHFVLFRKHFLPKYFFYALFSSSFLVLWIITIYVGILSISLVEVNALHLIYYSYWLGITSLSIVSTIF